MTAKEKAIELVEKFLTQPISFPYIDTVDKQCIGSGYMTYRSAVSCAIIAVDEIIKNLHWLEDSINFDKAIKFWQEVKTELNKL